MQGLRSSVICKKIKIKNPNTYFAVADEILLPGDVKEVVGVLILTSYKTVTVYDGAVGCCHLTFAESIRMNQVLLQDIGKIKKGYCFQEIKWVNNHEPIRIFFENLLPTSDFLTYDVLILLRTLNHY